MANHKSSIKRIRQNETKHLQNRYYVKITRSAIKKLRHLEVKAEAEASLKTVSGMLDKLAKKNVIHKNKAANLKSQLTLHVNAM